MTRTAADTVARRIAPRPVLSLDGPSPNLINIGDLDIAGCSRWIAPADLLTLIDQLEGLPRSGALSTIIVILRDRLSAHLDLLRVQAVGRAVEDIAREDLRNGATGTATHTKDRQLLAERVAVTHQAAARRVSKQHIWRELATARGLTKLPQTQAVARQGLLSGDKLEALTRATSTLPPENLTPAIEGGLIDAVVDVGLRAGRAQLSRLLAPLREALATSIEETSATDAVKAQAGMWATALEGGMAEVRIVDRAENIAAITTVIRAASRTLAQHGQPGTLGQLRALVVSEWAKKALRTGHTVGPCGSNLPLHADHGDPIRIRVIERPSLKLVPGLSKTTCWELPGLGVLTTRQYEDLLDGPEWDGIVRFQTMMSARDPDYLIACGLLVHGHDPPRKMIRLLRTRDSSTCRAPWCDDPTEPDDVHHAVPYSAGGATTLDNLVSLHADCHRVVHESWHVTPLGDGVFEFIDQHGTRYTSRPGGMREAA